MSQGAQGRSVQIADEPFTPEVTSASLIHYEIHSSNRVPVTNQLARENPHSQYHDYQNSDNIGQLGSLVICELVSRCHRKDRTQTALGLSITSHTAPDKVSMLCNFFVEAHFNHFQIGNVNPRWYHKAIRRTDPRVASNHIFMRIP